MARVSVVMAIYNSAATLGQAIESVLRQTDQNFEIVAVDDASTDNSQEILARYVAHHPDRIRMIHRDTNGGAAAARNDGIRATDSEFVSFLDADDLYLPRRLEAAVACLDRSPSAAAAYTDCRVCRSDGSELVPSLIGFSGLRRAVANWRDVSRCEPMHTNTMTIRRRCLERVGLFDERLRRGQDTELWLRLAHRYSFTEWPEVLAIWRWHEADTGQTLAEMGQTAADLRRRAAIWEVALEWLSSADEADHQFGKRQLARAYWLLAARLRLERSTQADAACCQARAYSTANRLHGGRLFGEMLWRMPSLLSVLHAARQHSRGILRAIGSAPGTQRDRRLPDDGGA